MEKNIQQDEKDTLVNEEVENQEVNTQDVSAEESTESSQDDNVIDINTRLDEEKMKEELTKEKEKYQRLQAEYSNYIRRTNQEKETIGLFANEKIITELIPVIDSMERAVEACDNKEDNLFEGINLVHKQLKDTLAKFGVEEIEAENADFDPNLHLAVMQESVDGIDANKVIMVLQKGYKLGTKVIRPTMVKVSC
ncbi:MULTISPECIES: nucleotide exchange factor GrpE [unclassified Romboutsia]|uniref:nucleotide exchange factor GrpE n=1 Tax=unclassified Romboutsia TaxID=2626894 RepID=UPI001A9B0787|nr:MULTISPECIES: nucleotide exchange factor GrpE [unclassified Romboutsia]